MQKQCKTLTDMGLGSLDAEQFKTLVQWSGLVDPL
jgi:hypothetical protein